MRGRRMVRKTSIRNANLEEIANDLKQLFEIDTHTEYEDFIPFKSGTPGFSVKRGYPSDIRFKPAITKERKPDNVALIRVIYQHYKQFEDDAGNISTPILIEMSMHSRYNYKHYGYNFDAQDCPTKESLMRMKESPAPVNIICDGYYYRNDNQIYDKEDDVINGYKLLNEIFIKHCNTTRRTIRFIWRIIAYIAEPTNHIKTLEFILRHAFRRALPKENMYMFSYGRKDLILLEAEPLNIFGYKAPKNVIVSYSVLVIVLYTINYLGLEVLSNPYIAGLYNNNFLLLCLVLVTLPFFEIIGPLILLLLINLFIRVRYWCIRHSPLALSMKKEKDDHQEEVDDV